VHGHTVRDVIVRKRHWTPAGAVLLRVGATFSIGLSAVVMMSPVLFTMGPTMTRTVALAGLAILLGIPLIRRVAVAPVTRWRRRVHRDTRTCRLSERLVIVRAPGDEASLLLAASALIERVGRIAVVALQRFALPVVLTLIGAVLLVVGLGGIALVVFGAGALFGGSHLVGGLTWYELAARLGLFEYTALATATGLAAALAVPMLMAMFVGGAAFGLDAGLLAPWLVSRAEESPSGRERIHRFESHPDHGSRERVREIHSTDAFEIVTRLFAPVVRDAWRAPGLAHTAIHDDPRVVQFVAGVIAGVRRAATASESGAARGAEENAPGP
jgi:hypothetical protein